MSDAALVMVKGPMTSTAQVSVIVIRLEENTAEGKLSRSVPLTSIAWTLRRTHGMLNPSCNTLSIPTSNCSGRQPRLRGAASRR